LLKGFEFNNSARLGSTLYALFTTAIDRAAGTLIVAKIAGYLAVAGTVMTGVSQAAISEEGG
jgi:hypothetical protein